MTCKWIIKKKYIYAHINMLLLLPVVPLTYWSAINVLGLFQQETVRDMVTSPLNTLLALFEAPSKVIQKRFDKLLDYDSMQRKVTDGRVRVITCTALC